MISLHYAVLRVLLVFNHMLQALASFYISQHRQLITSHLPPQYHNGNTQFSETYF